MKVEMIAVGKIDPPSNPVRAVKIGAMEELRDSIEADGLYQPIIVRPKEDVQRNTHLDPIREGEIFCDLKEKGWTVERIAKKIGKRNLAYVTDRMRVYDRLHPKLQREVSKGRLSFQNAKAIADLPLTTQLEVGRKVRQWRLERQPSRRKSECTGACEIHCPPRIL